MDAAITEFRSINQFEFKGGGNVARRGGHPSRQSSTRRWMFSGIAFQRIGYLTPRTSSVVSALVVLENCAPNPKNGYRGDYATHDSDIAR
jgi:hypothetical protein